MCREMTRSIPIERQPIRNRPPLLRAGNAPEVQLSIRSPGPLQLSNRNRTFRSGRRFEFIHGRQHLPSGTEHRRPGDYPAEQSGYSQRATGESSGCPRAGKSLSEPSAIGGPSADIGTGARGGGREGVCPLRGRPNRAQGDDPGLSRPLCCKSALGKTTPPVYSQRGICNVPGRHGPANRHCRQEARQDRSRSLVS